MNLGILDEPHFLSERPPPRRRTSPARRHRTRPDARFDGRPDGRPDGRHDATRPDTGRCGWCGDDVLYVAYHDAEWGVPVHDDRNLFEMLILEGAQAGLSWRTILGKRQAYRRAYDGFDPARVARFDARRIARLVVDPGIVRHRGKIEASVGNARAFLAVQREHVSFDRYLWSFVRNRPIQGRRAALSDVPARTAESDALSKDLRARGFKFVGSTIVYAFMQAVGLVNDHVAGCFREPEVRRLGAGRLPRTGA